MGVAIKFMGVFFILPGEWVGVILGGLDGQ